VVGDKLLERRGDEEKWRLYEKLCFGIWCFLLIYSSLIF